MTKKKPSTEIEPLTPAVTPFGTWPPPVLPTGQTNFTPQAGTHPADHANANDAINTIVTFVTALDGRVDVVSELTSKTGGMRGRSNTDAVGDGGAVPYKTDHGNYGLTIDSTMSSYTVPTGIYGIWFSTVPDAGSDMTCYLDVAGASVAVGVRLPGDGPTYGSWTGRVPAGGPIIVRVRMPVPRAVTGGFLTIWRVGEANP